MLFNLMRIVLVIILATSNLSYSKSLNNLYCTPGFSIQWNSQKFISFGWKVSVGYLLSNESYDENRFVNITFGKRYLLTHIKSNKNYCYLEIESGLNKELMCYGLGMGTAFIKEKEKLVIVPKGSVFTGFLLFVRSDIIRYDNKYDLDVGCSVILPLANELISEGAFID